MSNHGGRQLETSPPTIDVLPSIRAAVGDDVEARRPQRSRTRCNAANATHRAARRRQRTTHIALPSARAAAADDVEACSPAAPHRSSGLGRGCDRVAPPARAWLGRRRPTSYQVILDGGVMRGTHIAKALALGADSVAVGKAYLYGLAAGGEAGVRKALSILEEELERAMGLLGTGEPRLRDWYTHLLGILMI